MGMASEWGDAQHIPTKSLNSPPQGAQDTLRNWEHLKSIFMGVGKCLILRVSHTAFTFSSPHPSPVDGFVSLVLKCPKDISSLFSGGWHSNMVNQKHRSSLLRHTLWFFLHQLFLLVWKETLFTSTAQGHSLTVRQRSLRHRPSQLMLQFLGSSATCCLCGSSLPHLFCHHRLL